MVSVSEGATEPYEWQKRTVHDLRRSYGTVMARRVPLHDLNRLMCHSNFQTTEAFYLGVSDDLDAKVADAFAAVA